MIYCTQLASRSTVSVKLLDRFIKIAVTSFSPNSAVLSTQFLSIQTYQYVQLQYCFPMTSYAYTHIALSAVTTYIGWCCACCAIVIMPHTHSVALRGGTFGWGRGTRPPHHPRALGWPPIGLGLLLLRGWPSLALLLILLLRDHKSPPVYQADITNTPHSFGWLWIPLWIWGWT